MTLLIASVLLVLAVTGIVLVLRYLREKPKLRTADIASKNAQIPQCIFSA